MAPDVVQDAKDGGHGKRGVNAYDFTEAERRHIYNLEKEALNSEEGGGAISDSGTASNSFICPRQEREAMAPSDLSLREIKRQIDIEFWGSKRCGTTRQILVPCR